jgi:hypothetical protein
VQEHTERPVGMALYEMKNGQISNICIQGGACAVQNSRKHASAERTPRTVSVFRVKLGGAGRPFAWAIAGPKGEGGLDDATGAGGSGGGASMKQSSGAVDLGQ